jgi:hypothetical protein
MSSWIKLSRKIRTHWVYKDADYFKAWVTILTEVNFKPVKVLIQGELLECNRGQSVNSLATWVSILGDEWTIQKFRTFIKLLEKDEMINIEGLRKTTRLTVCNYDSYQSEQQTNNTQTTDKQHTANTQLTTNKNVKKEKNEENTIPTEEDFLAHGLSKMPDVSIEALRMKYESWIENDWCTNKDGKKRKIQNWKSTLNNTLPFLPKQPKVFKSGDDELFDNVMRKLNGV